MGFENTINSTTTYLTSTSIGPSQATKATECISHWSLALHLCGGAAEEGDAVGCTAVSAAGLASQWQEAVELMVAGMRGVCGDGDGLDRWLFDCLALESVQGVMKY